MNITRLPNTSQNYTIMEQSEFQGPTQPLEENECIGKITSWARPSGNFLARSLFDRG
jgi:hypothetical protein